MKKKILIGAATVAFLIIILFIYTFILSFKVVKKNTDSINLELKKQFQKIVRIPDPVSPSYKGFGKTIYTWEMETRAKEVTKVAFIHDTAFSRSQKQITASLEMPEGEDPSLFDKVMEAVVSDPQALNSAKDQPHANLSANQSIGYNKIEMVQSTVDSSKIIKITWEFDRDKLTESSKQYFDNMNKYPEPVITKLYFLQRSALIMLAP